MNTRMHSSRMRTAPSSPYRKSLSVGETPWIETPLDRDPPGQRPPWTETPIRRTWDQAARQEVTSCRDPPWTE